MYSSSSLRLLWGPSMKPLCLAAVLLVILLSSSAQAIAKQQQQQRSDDQQSQQSASSSSFNQQASMGSANGQSLSPASSQQQQNSPSQQQITSSSSYTAYNQSPAGVSGKSSPDYADNSEHSYQAAAQSVNMALVNSGIFGPSQYQSTGAASSASAPSSGSSNQNQANLNPVHYFYYPSKESSQAVGLQQQQSTNGQQVAKDMLSSASNGQQSSYPSMSSAYPSYTDQFNSALSSISANPDVAASSQDPSYLPQPMVGASVSDNQYGSNLPMQSAQNQNLPNDPMASYSSSQQSQQMQPQQHQPQQSSSGQPQSPQSQPQNLQPGGSISFKGPTSAQNAQNDYLNSHINQQQSLAYQSLYNQLNDLSTSNFGSPASSLASYLSPSSSGLNSQQRDPHADLFSGSALPQSFSSAASHLSPASVSPPVQASQYGNLFGSQQTSQPLFSAAAAASASNPAHYLSHYLSAGPFGQLAASPDTSMLGSASSPAASSMAPTSTGSSKRFGIGSFIMPVLALAGLSLLIPTMSNIGTAVGRKKRSIAEDARELGGRTGEIVYEPLNGSSQNAKELSIGEYLDKLERYYSIYQSALQNEECLNRLICEFGVAVKDVSGKSAALTVIEKLVPNWMTGKMHLFKEAAMDKRSDAASKCSKYVCTNSRQHF